MRARSIFEKQDQLLFVLEADYGPNPKIMCVYVYIYINKTVTWH